MKIKVIIEKTSDGFSAYAEKISLPVGTMGDSIEEIRKNMIDALNLHQKHHHKTLVKETDLDFQFDLASFFAYYKVINAKALGERIGMHQSLLAQYISGKKKPSSRQVERIMEGIQEVAHELIRLKIA
ncbi:MAG: helix-turn-helix transcriptional regulator [Bacteroidetes bacterium]|nr:helix-turn-helix transcriptional regulator [Bacteroidota bacterium]